MKTRLYSDERETAVTMISGTCLVCDYQGVPHRIFCEVTAGRRQPGRPETEHLRYRLEGVLAVSLSLGAGMPDGLCLKCEKGLCEIESRVRGFRDMHHATREKYRQMRVTGDAFICDLTRLETRHSEGGSETRTETETRPETETYLPQTSLLPAQCSQVWWGSDPRRGSRGHGEVCREGEVTPQSVIDTAGVQSTGCTTGMPVRPAPMPAEHRNRIGGAQHRDNTMDANSKVSKTTHSTISSYTDSTTKAYGNMATKHRNSISREVDNRTEVNGNMPTRVSGHLDDGQMEDSSRPTEHWNGIDSQVNGTIEHASRMLANHRKSISGEFKDIADDAYCGQSDTQCNANSVNLTHNRQNGSHQELAEDKTCVNGCSAEEPCFVQGDGCYTDTFDKTCPCSMYYDRNHVKQTVNAGVELLPENRPSALNLSQTVVPERDDDTNGLVLDLTVPRSLPERQNIKLQTRNVDDAINNAANGTWMPTEANKPVQSQTDYPIGNRQGGDGQWENSHHQEKLCVNGTSQSTWACSKAPPPLIHVSQIKKEPIENDLPFNKRHMSSLDYLQKMPFCIAPIEEGKGVGQEQFYDDSFLSEPPHKKYKYARGYSVASQDAPTSSFPVLNTHVSATLNVTHPGEDANRNITDEKTPDLNHNPSLGETVQTTTIQGTIRIPLNQLQNMKQAPANISLMTEATVNSIIVPSHKQESTNEQPQQSQHTAKIPVNMRINADELRARIPLHEVFLDHVQPAQPSPGVNQLPGSRRVLNALHTHGIPVHHLDTSGHPRNSDSVNVSHLRKGLQPPEWMRFERPIQGVHMGNPQPTTNLHLPQLGLEVTGPRGQGHRVQGQGHIASEKLGSTYQMASYGWQHPRFSRAVVGQSQAQGQGQGRPIFPNILPDKRVPQGHISESKPQQRQPHPSQPQGHSKSLQGQAENEPQEGQTRGQGQNERSSDQHQIQEQSHQGRSEKGYTRQGLASQGQGQVHETEPGHSIEGLPVEGQAVQNTKVQKTNQLDTTQTKAESEDEEDEEDDGKDVTEQDINTSNLISRNDSSGRRQLLRPWLEARLNRGNIPGFQWVDKDRNLFKIPWKHRSKNDWSPDNCTIFMEWALHTGKHRVGVDKPDYCRWKTRLRCAFNQAADIQERKDLNKMKCSEPYKVYEFLSKSEIKPKPPSKPKPQLDVSKMQALTTTTILPPGVPGTVPHAASSTHTLTDNMSHTGATLQPPQSVDMYTAVTGALMAVGGPLIHHDGGLSSGPPSSASDLQDTPPPPATSSQQISPNTTKMAAEPFQAEPVSIPVETNNNKFSWDADLDDEGPLVIDLDRDNVQDGNSKLLCADNRQNRQTQGAQFSYIHKQQRTRDGAYTCHLCGQCFTLAEALGEHKDRIHGVFSDKSEAMCNSIDPTRSDA